MELALGVWNLGLSAPPHYSLNAEAPALSSLPSCSDQASRGRLHPTSIPGRGLGQAPGGLELVCAMWQQRVHLHSTRGALVLVPACLLRTLTMYSCLLSAQHWARSAVASSHFIHTLQGHRCTCMTPGTPGAQSQGCQTLKPMHQPPPDMASESRRDEGGRPQTPRFQQLGNPMELCLLH